MLPYLLSVRVSCLSTYGGLPCVSEGGAFGNIASIHSAVLWLPFHNHTSDFGIDQMEGIGTRRGFEGAETGKGGLGDCLSM
jgi:hypothetical protein